MLAKSKNTSKESTKDNAADEKEKVRRNTQCRPRAKCILYFFLFYSFIFWYLAHFLFFSCCLFVFVFYFFCMFGYVGLQEAIESGPSYLREDYMMRAKLKDFDNENMQDKDESDGGDADAMDSD